MWQRVRSLGVVLLWGACVPMAAADTVRVAVAANFAAPFQRIAQQFEADTGHQVEVSVGASGKLFAQIQNGAPFAVFLSADDERPAALEKSGFAVAGTRFVYARGQLVLWSRRPNWIDAQGQVLRQGGFNKLAIANPDSAPYGRAAIETLTAMGLRETLASRVVMGESIGQTFHFVNSGAAELGFIARSQLDRSAAGSAWVVPEKLHQPILQEAVLIKDQPAARALLRFLQAPAARAVIQQAGYGVTS